MTTDFFPLKLAFGENFCNRQEERRLLANNISKSRHTVLYSPRRYGKSSLVQQVIFEQKKPFASIDFFLANNDATITRRIMNGVEQAVSKILPVESKLIGLVQSIFKSFKIKLGVKSFSIEYSFSDIQTQDSIDIIFEALNSLSELANKYNKTVVFYIDEFQDVTASENFKGILGAIRHVAQESKYLCFIFSGSNRHLLSTLFDDRSMPLYLLCDKIILERINTEEYQKHLNKLAIQKWNQELNSFSFELIMKLTETHAFYVNMLCNILWDHESPPTRETILEGWEKCYEIEHRRLISELDFLTNIQQDVIKTLALNPTTEPFGHKFSQLVRRSPSSVRQSIKALLEKDLIYIIEKEDKGLPMRKKGQLRVLDPLMRYALTKYQ